MSAASLHPMSAGQPTRKARPPSPDIAEILRALAVLHGDGGVIELRALHKRKRVDAGCFDSEHWEVLAKEAARLNRGGTAVYITLNEVDPQLLSRHANRIEEHAAATATDLNVVRRRWLLVDIDPQRPKDTSATNDQLKLASERAESVRQLLNDRGWTDPLIAESGNGFHLVYRIDLPNDAASADLVKGCLEALAKRFDDSAIKIDRAVFNAARIIKLYGTVATKGDHLEHAPHRLSRITSMPDEPRIVDASLLHALAGEAKHAVSTHQSKQPTSAGRAWTEADVISFLARANLEASGPDPHNGALRWKLEWCPFNSDHGRGESAVFLCADGRLGFDCRHSSCQDKRWSDLRALVDGERTNGAAGTNRSTSGASVEVGPESSEDAQESWTEPVNILAELAAPRFEATDLPECLGEFPAAYSATTGIDRSIALTAAVTTAAAALSDEFQVVADPKTRWYQSARLWMLTIGRPGAAKSPAQREMLAPLWSVQRELREQHQRAAAALPDDEKAPPEPKLIVVDTTIEALSEVLRHTVRGVLIANDEFEGWMGSHDAYRKGGASRDRGEWLRAFDGGPHSIERVNRGSVYVDNWGVSMLSATTPAVLAKLARHLPEDGLMQRFIPVCAQRQGPAGASQVDVESARERYAETLRRLYVARPQAHAGKVALSLDAQSEFRQWRERNQLLMEAMGSVSTAYEAHLAKHPTMVLRVALVFHAVGIVNLEPGARDIGAWSVTGDTMRRAIVFMRRASQHAMTVYLGLNGGSEAFDLARDIGRCVIAHGGSHVARRDLMQRVRVFRGAEPHTQSAALQVLIDSGWLRPAEGGYTKAQPTRYEVNPMLADRMRQEAERERNRRAAVREAITDNIREARSND